MTDPSPIVDFGNVQNPLTLAFFAIIIGAFVRVLRSKKVGDLLDAVPVTWINRIPKQWLPWIATALGVVLVFADLTLNAHVPWQQAAVQSLLGVFSGSLAVNGHETIAKLFASKEPPPAPPGSKLGPDDSTLDVTDETSKPLQRVHLSPLAMMLLLLTGCSSFWTPARKDAVIDAAQRRAKCAASMIGEPVTSILDKCGKTLSDEDVKDFTDLIFGMKEGAAAYGATIPDAPKVPLKDAGANDQ